MRKRILSWVLALVMCLTLLPASALAEETAGEPQAAETVTSETFTVDTSGADLPDNDELFAAYVQQLIYPGYGVMPLANWGETTDVLTDNELTIYRGLKNFASQVAEGTLTTTQNWTIDLTEPLEWTYENLDVSGWDDSALGQNVANAFAAEIDINKVVNCLLADCPNSFYWYDKAYQSETVSAMMNGYLYAENSEKTGVTISQLSFDLVVAEDYRSGDSLYTVDTNAIDTAKAAIANAKAIVTAHSGESPYQQMKAYKEEICRLTSYNTAATAPGTAYGDPWQLIYVFDGKSDTKVVCEGYAKAFQYLCDLANLTCYTVTGTMEGGTGAGDHMWNIVKLDGNNYLVDVTNCDGEEGGSYSIGYPDLLFLKAPDAGGSPEAGYTFTIDDLNKISYTYDSDTKNLYNSTILTLAGADYQEPTPEPGDVDITSLTVNGLTAPVKGGTPVTVDDVSITNVTVTDSAAPAVTVTDLTWDPNVTEFAPSTEYTATLILTAPEGYQFTGDTVVTVAWASSISTLVNADGTLKVTVTFPATDSETPAPVEGLTRAELAQLLYNKFTPGYTPTASAPDFDDISGCTEAQQKAIRALAELGYLSGTGVNAFSPTVTVNAAGAATLMARIITGNSSATSDALVTLGILTSSEVADTTMQDATLEKWLARFVTRAELAEQLNSETYSWLHNSIHLMTPSLSVQFDDLNVCTDAQKTAIGTLFEKQILSGTGPDTFHPTGVVTRAQAAVVLWRAAGSRSNVTPQSLPYMDVKASQWYAAAINCLYAMEVLTADDATNSEFGLDTVASVNGLTSWLSKCDTALGRDDLDEIAPVGGITRAEMAEKVYNDYQTLLEALPIVSGREKVAFTDISGCTEAQKAAIEFFYQRGIISGTDPTGGTTFTPYAAASNAQIAVFLHRCATAASSAGTGAVMETTGDGTLQASLLHYDNTWYAAAVEFLFDQGAFSSAEDFTNPDAPGIGTEMTDWNNRLKPIRPTITCSNGTITISGQKGETVYYTTNGSAPIDNGKVYTTPFTVSAVTTVKAVAVRNNMVSAVVSETCQPAPSELTVTLSQDTFTYNGSSQKPTVTVMLGEDELTENTHYTVSYTNSTNAGIVTVTVTGIGAYNGKTGTDTYTIEKAALIITANPQTITYGNPIAQGAAWYTATGLCTPDTLTNITLTASTTNVTTTGTITPSDAVIKNGDMVVTDNYDITYEAGTLIIQKANPTITFQDYAPGKTYNGAPLAVPTADQLTITGGGIYDNVKFTWYQGAVGSGTPLASAPKDAGTYYVVASIDETDNTTEATATSGPITISKRAITVTPDSGQSKVYGAADPVLTYKVSGAGLVDGETLIGALSRDAGTDVDTYEITQGTLTNDVNPNYTITFVSGETFAITQAPQAALTITGQPDTVTYGDSSFTLTTTGGSGTGAVTWAVTAGTAASVAANGAVQIYGVGNVTITATKAGDGNYKDASASWTFTVQQKPVTATVTAQDKTYDGNPTATVTATVTEGLEDGDSITITGLTGTFADANAGEDKAVTVNTAGAQVTGTNSDCYKIIYQTQGVTATISKDTSATPPASCEGYTLDYAAETITVTSGYEVSTAAAETGTTVPSGSISAYLGQTLYIRKAEDANHTASGWTAFTLAARPGAPVAAIAQTNETVLGKGDGAVTGITAAMEYQINGGAWTDGPGNLTGLAAGTEVTVRVKATSSAPHGLETTCTIAAGPAITVTFNSQGGSSVDGVTGLSYGSKVTKPADPARENYEFLGWYEEAAGTTPWNFGTDTVTADTTLYAKWKQVKFSVSVTVTQNGGDAASGATVTLAQGNKTFDTGTTGTDGKFTFGRYIPAGAYNIVTAYTPSGGEEQTKTSLVVITNENADVAVRLPSLGVNSVLTVAGDDTPAVVVGGLDEEAEALKTGDVTKVTVSMKVEEQSAAQADGANQIQQTANGQVLQFLDIRVQATVETDGDTGVTPINKTTTVLEIVVPFDFEGKTDVTVYRYHDGAAGTLAEVDTKADGTYQLDTVNGLIHIFASKFSTYAIGYTTDDEEPVTPPVTPVDPVIPSTPSTGGSEPDGDYTVTVDRTTGGKVTVNPGRADKGDTVTITAIPNDGYVVDEVTVNGLTNGVKYLGNNKYSFTMPGSSAKISVTFVKEGAQTDLPFADVSESFWARNEIQWAYENGYVNGSTATAFNPNGTISRQQVWMILARIAGEDPANMAEAKAWAIANGVSDGSNPGSSVTRQQLVTILYRFAGQNGYDTTARADLSGYPDVTTVASYASEAMAWAVAEGIIGGTTQGTLNPAGTASRAQFAVILYRYMA